MSKVIYNSLQSSDLSIAALSGPGRVTDVSAKSVPAPVSSSIDLLSGSVADQINAQRMSYTPPFKAVDLENMIVDIIVETSAQGSGLLEVHLIDPYWMLLRRDPTTGSSFIDVDPSGDGYLWPPIEVNFPPTASDATWRLCQVKSTTDIGDANLVLVFEDKIVAEMREHDAGGNDPTDPSLGSSNAQETRSQFIKRCVKTVSANPLLSSDVGIRFVSLLDPSDNTAADLVGTEVTLPASATQPAAPNNRVNYLKGPGVTNGLVSPGTDAALRAAGAGATLLAAAPTELGLQSGTFGGKSLAQLLAEAQDGPQLSSDFPGTTPAPTYGPPYSYPGGH